MVRVGIQLLITITDPYTYLFFRSLADENDQQLLDDSSDMDLSDED